MLSGFKGESFVTQKIAASVARIFGGDEDHVLSLGNLDSCRDWGHAQDYMDGIWRMMQATAADDFVLCSGESHSVREFTEVAFGRAGFRIR
jgi:GDPmannose 4,6-dehydratase